MRLPSRDDVLRLREQAVAVVPDLVTLGIASARDGDRVSMLYSYPFGLGEFDLPRAAVMSAVEPGGSGRRTLDAQGLAARPPGAFEGFQRQGDVQRLDAVHVPGRTPAARFWTGGATPDALSERQWAGLEALAASTVAALVAEEPDPAPLARLLRLEQAAALVPALLEALDVREVFDRLSATARHALPHDLLLLRLFSDDFATITVYASTATGVQKHAVPNAYPAAMIAAWSFDIVDDLARHPYEQTQPTAKLGARSSLRVPITIGARIVGGLAALSFTPAAFTTDDVPVAKRLAEFVAIGLSHYQLAEEGRQAAALRERRANLEMLDGLLGTLTGVLDVRDVFERVSAIAQTVLPHDGLSILEILDDGRARVHASHGLGDLPRDVPPPVPALAADREDTRIIDDYADHPEYAGGPGESAGMRSALFVSIHLDGRTFGGVNFYSRTPRRFTRDDLLVARRVTDHVALALSHSRLAEQARISDELRARTTSLELLDELLSALLDEGSLRDAFERISTIAAKVLPHDAAAVLVHLPDGRHGRIYASKGYPVEAPDVIEIPAELLEQPDWDHHVIDDVTPLAGHGYSIMRTIGLQSLLRVAIRLDGRVAGGLMFASRRTSGFGAEHVPIARRLADRVSVALARNRELDAERRADEAGARAARLEARVRALTDELDARTGYRRVIGESKEWRQVLTQATQVAATETTALLLGESGTGKEVVARFIHRASPRSGGPFVALNCAALPEQLLEAELFGYERGAFTGAVQSKPGQLEQAAGGTLFLDEVGEMSPTAQAKFLRVLQEREFQRLGGTRVLRSEARVVAATNRDLPRAIAQQQFREDLYYRLNVFAIRLPPLRDRRDDILPLCDAFLSEIGRGLGRPPGGISHDAKAMLLAYSWPGNVRELRNALERAAILCEGGLITADLLGLHPSPAAVPVTAPPPVPAAPPAPQGLPAVASGPSSPAGGVPSSADDLAAIEKTMIEQALQGARFNKSKAAAALGMTRHQLYVRMRRHGLE